MPGCALDETGKPVDWWFAYKVPKLTQSAGVDDATGYEYVYFDPNATVVAKSPNRMDHTPAADVLECKSKGGRAFKKKK